MAKIVEKKFQKIKLLMSFLGLLNKPIDEFDCLNKFEFSPRKIKKLVYAEISRLAIQ